MGNKRARQRERMRLYASVRGAYDATSGELVDVSEIGLRLKLQKSILVKPGETVDIAVQRMGLLQGQVKWQRFKMMGVALNTSTNSYAQTLSAIRRATQQ